MTNKNLENFWKKVNKSSSNECWNWIGGRHPTGYGNFFLEKKTVYSHRVSWEIHKGNIPKDMHVLHSCDNPSCVNPSHLFLGTHIDNMKDRDSKNRRVNPRGESHGKSKLTKEDVKKIREEYKTGKFSQRKLAKIYNISQTQIWVIVNRIQWSHVE